MKVIIILWYFWFFVDINVYVVIVYFDLKELIFNVICFYFLFKMDLRRCWFDFLFI